MNDLLAAALEYAARGWEVFPCHSIEDGVCTCGNRTCGSPGKHPRTKHGVLDATKDAEQIRAWWSRWPDANVAIATGARSGIAVVDIDPRNGGNETAGNLQITATKYATRMAFTGSRGWHFYYQISEPTPSGELGPGVDFQADGKYVIAPPSKHISGLEYSWLSNDELIPLPAAFRPKLPARALKPRPEVPGIIEPDQKEWVAELLNQPCGEGSRNKTLTRLAGYFRNQLPELVALTILLDWNRRCCQPPLPDEEVIECVKHKYRRYAGLPEPERTEPTAWTWRSILDTEIPEPEMVVEKILPVGLTILAGRPKNYKSWLAQQIAKDVATASASLTFGTRPGKVIYIAMEDSPLRLKKRLRLMSAPATDDVIVYTDFRPLDDGGLGDLAELITKHEPVLVVIDTLARIISGKRDQGRVGEMTEVVGPLQKLALMTNTAILVIDHHRKGGIEVKDVVDDVMESTAKTAVADAIWGLYRKRGETSAKLVVTGRDIEEQELAIEWDGLQFHWRMQGPAEEVEKQRRWERCRKVVMRDGYVTPRSLQEEIGRTQVSDDTTGRWLKEWAEQGKLIRTRHGQGKTAEYRLPQLVYAEEEEDAA